MAKKDYNMIVIGGGSAGLSSAYIAAAVKAKVALIEKNKMGGDCLNTGCVPSKALIRTTRVLSYIKRHKDYGIKSAEAFFDFGEVMDRVHKVIGKVEPHDSVERYTKLGVDCHQGEAKIISPHEVSVNGKTLTTQNIIVATGARPFVPPIKGLDKIKFLTSDNIWELRTLPKRLVIAGGGHVGKALSEIASLCGFRVTVIDDRPEYADPERFPEAEKVIRGRFDEVLADYPLDSTTYVVAVTRGHKHDEASLRSVIGRGAAYVEIGRAHV